MSPSFAVKFDIYGAVPPNSISTTGIYSNGAYPNDDPPASIDMAPSGIDLHSGHVFRVLLVYDGVTLQQTVTDTSTNAAFTHNYTIDIATTISGVDAYVGFTGSTGGFTSTQEHPHVDILSYAFAVRCGLYRFPRTIAGFSTQSDHEQRPTSKLPARN